MIGTLLTRLALLSLTAAFLATVAPAHAADTAVFAVQDAEEKQAEAAAAQQPAFVGEA